MDSEMKVNARLIRKLREERAWSQDHLATAAGLSLRTVQRIESEGNASSESRLALAAAFGVEVSLLVLAETESETGYRGPQSPGGLETHIWRSRRFPGAVIGIVCGFIGATVGVASAWVAAGGAAQSSAEIGVAHSVLGAVYGVTCAALAIVWNRHRAVNRPD